VDLEPDKQDLIGAVIAPLKGTDAQRDFLENALRLASGTPTTLVPDSLEAAIARMQATASTSKRRSIALRLFTVLALALSVVFLLSPSTFRSVSRIFLVSYSYEFLIPDFVDDLFPEDTTEQDTTDWIMERIAPDQRLVAMGEVSETYDPRRWEAVWKAHPEDPAHFYAYVLAFREEKGAWPEKWVDTGERLDPANGWFALIDACSRIREVVEPEKKPVKGRGRGAPVVTPGQPPHVKDQVALEKLLDQIDHALALPEWDDYRLRLCGLRMSPWAAPADYPEQLLSVRYRSEHPERDIDDSYSLSQLSLLFRAASLHFVDTGNRAGLDALANRFLGIFRTLVAKGHLDLMEGYYVWRAIEPTAKAIAEAYHSMGDSATATRFKDLAAEPRRVIAGSARGSSDALSERKGSRIASNWDSGIRGVSPVSETELRGGRLAEYAMTLRLLVHLLAGLLCIVVGLLLFSAHHPKPEARSLADRLLQLLSGRDWLWILGLGLFLPIALFSFLQWFPWPGLCSHTMTEAHSQVMALQLAGLALSFLLCTVEVVRWRLAKRAWVLGFGWRLLDAGPAFALAALISMPFMSAVPALAALPDMEGDWIEASIATALGLPALWASMILIVCYLKKSPRRLHRLILLRACTPVMALALALSVLSIFVIHAEEKKWTARIEFESVTNKDHYATGSRAGFEHARWIHSELKAIFGPGPD
jgi:hypothetical protein